MPEKKIEGVNINDTGQKKMQRDYTQSDVEALLRRGHWNDWGEMIQWLEVRGEKNHELTPGETIAMVEDLRQVQQSGEPFTNDPHRVYQLMHQYRTGRREGELSPEEKAREEAAAEERARARREQEAREEAVPEERIEAQREREEVPEEAGLWSEKGILRKGGYIWRD